MAAHTLYAVIFFLLVGPALAAPAPDDFGHRLAAAALARTKVAVVYDPTYYRIPYPGGDVPADRGACADVVVRSYRALGTDLQKEVHEDMAAHFGAYPQNWGLARPDSNIDHRRVPNLRAFFTRKGRSLPVTQGPASYTPGDIVTWNLTYGSGGNLPHIGIVTDKRSVDGARPLIVHNIGRGPQLEDMLFLYHITGHYRYKGP